MVFLKYLKQFLIIIAISFVGELLKYILPFPVPASIYGMVIMFVCLTTGLIKLDQVREASKFLIEIMPVMFIPAGVGLITAWADLSDVLIPVSIITVFTIFTVMVVSGHVAQFTIRHGKKDK